MALTCPVCAYNNPQGSSFCIHCGSKLHANGTSSSPLLPTSSKSMPGSAYQSSSSLQSGYQGYQQYQQYAQQQFDLSPALKHTETTRYLCAAAYLDEDVQDYVMKNIVEEEHRAIGQLYGVDVVPVVKWCFAARQRIFTRNLILALLLFVTMFTYIQQRFSNPLFFFLPPADQTLIFILAFLILLVALSVLSLLPLVIQVLVTLATVFFFRQLALFFIVAWAVVAIEMGISYYGTKAGQLAKGKFRPDSIQFTLNPTLEQKLKNTFHSQDGNIVVYSGYSPFVGAGFPIREWSFIIDTSKGKEEAGVVQTPVPFTATELYDSVAEAIRDLGLSDLSLEDKLYVNGQEIRDDKRFLDNPFARPYTQAPPAVMQGFIEAPTQDIRYYKCIRVTSWRGELVVSIFVRFVKVGKSLFAEANYLLLPPLKESYYRVDTVETSLTIRKIWDVMRWSFFPTFRLWLRSPINVLSSICHNWLLMQECNKIERLIKENPAFDYGASTSLREVAGSSKYRRYFQRLDKEMYVKIIEKQLLESIVSFLDARNIDTTDLKERQETILNNGVIVSSGGVFSAGNVAVGEQAKAVFSGITETARTALGASKQQTSKGQ
jgi:hypothetical protein